MKILDCTLRDGGYYTNWDFNKFQVDQYISSLNNLPVDYIEVGYRSPNQKAYCGKYFYLPLFELEDIKRKTNKKLVIILNEKDVRPEHLDELLLPIVGLVTMVRMAIDPENLSRAIILAKEVKKYGFEIGFNVMYMSKWKDNSAFIEALSEVDNVADYFYMVDSYGGVFPTDVVDIINLVKSKTNCKLGFHGHDNLELALINTLTALDHGVEIIDSTILGMGRGAGNLRTELFLTVLNAKYNIAIDFNALENAVSAISPLLDQYQWGTNLPYMISGINSLPQKDVMDWVGTRFYSLNTIIRALDNKKNKIQDNDKYPIASFNNCKQAVIVGGGLSVEEHIDGILSFLNTHQDITVIHASSKNAGLFKSIKNHQIFCLVGNEGRRLESVFESLDNFVGNCVLPPYPRKMGTYVPSQVASKVTELESITVSDKYQDAHTTLALQIAINMEVDEILILGYDGYKDVIITEKEKNLNEENNHLFGIIKNINHVDLVSLTPTYYSILPVKSLYSLI